MNLCVLAPVSIAAATVLALSGCGSQTASDGGSTPSAVSSPTVTSAPSTNPAGAFVIGDAGVTVAGNIGEKPTVTVGSDTKGTTQLTVKDLVVGTGPEAKAGDTVTAHYVGIGAITGQQFDSSWDRGQAAQFPLDQVIVGWQNGIPGMKVGGRRLLVIPGDQAYGANPPGGANIQPNETLIFVVDLVSIP